MQESSCTSIVLHHRRPPVRVDSDHVYFPFASGRLTYDCETCKAQCCRGHGYSIREGHELSVQLGGRPNLKLFLDRTRKESGDTYTVRNCAPACFFLDKGGLCGIHVEHGYQAKPETCRLFPFNNFRQLGEFLIVAPHEQLCPLEILPAGITNYRSSHEHLLVEMSSQGISTEIPDHTEAGLRVESVVGLERIMVSLSEEYASSTRYRDFFRAQLAATRRFLGQSALAESENESYADGFLEQVCSILGTALTVVDPHDPVLARATIALTPLLRSKLVFRDPKSGDKRGSISIARVPHFVIAAHAIAAVAKDVGMDLVTFQTIMKIAHEFEPLLLVLAHADCAMTWVPGMMLDLPVPRNKTFELAYLRVARALLPSTQRATQRPLSAILREADSFDSVERILFLKVVARRLKGRIMRLADLSNSTRVRSKVRPAVQRWALAHLDEQVLSLAYQRRFVP